MTDQSFHSIPGWSVTNIVVNIRDNHREAVSYLQPAVICWIVLDAIGNDHSWVITGLPLLYCRKFNLSVLQPYLACLSMSPTLAVGLFSWKQVRTPACHSFDWARQINLWNLVNNIQSNLKLKNTNVKQMSLFESCAFSASLFTSNMPRSECHRSSCKEIWFAWVTTNTHSVQRQMSKSNLVLLCKFIAVHVRS